MSAVVEFWFDFSCPYAYLASTQIERVARGARLLLRPMLLGGLFRDIGAGAGPMATISAARTAYIATDLARWAARYKVELRSPPSHPQRTLLPLRTMLALPEAWEMSAMHALFAAYWRDGVDVTARAAVVSALIRGGVPHAVATAAVADADSELIKQRLRQQTQIAAASGVFGAPSMFVRDGERSAMFWGQDRMHWVEAALAGWWPDEPACGPPPVLHPIPRGPLVAERVDLYFDVASPFAYLGAQRIEAATRELGAPVRWVPILLGALFRDIGTPDVPWFSFPPAKQRYIGRDLEHWSRWWSVPFRFPARFPQRSLLAQRAIIAAGDNGPKLALRLFAAMWTEGRSIDDPAVVAAIASEVGLPATLLAEAEAEAVKAQLRANTNEARSLGAFGVPTMVAHRSGGRRDLYWGQDRLALMAAGW